MAKYEALDDHTLRSETDDYGPCSIHVSYVDVFNFEAGCKTSIRTLSYEDESLAGSYTREETPFCKMGSEEIKSAYDKLVEKLAETGRKPSFRCIVY